LKQGERPEADPGESIRALKSEKAAPDSRQRDRIPDITRMVLDKNRKANFRLSARERKQFLFWGSIFILAMICLMYLITPSTNAVRVP
jgi:hypothetical protein